MTQSDKSMRDSLPVGRLYEVDGRHLMLHRSGTGGPAVVFLPGAGFIGLGYLNIHEKISQRTTSVIYDRAGTGWSDKVKLPRSAAEVTDELRLLLQKAEIPAPYVLVGHSLGGIYARRFAQRYPDEVAGILMLDPGHEGYLLEPKLKKRQLVLQVFKTLRVLLHYKRFYHGMYERAFAGWPKSIREPLISYHLSSLGKTIQEGKNIASELYDEVIQGGDMPDVPLIVLTAMEIDPSQAVILPEPHLRKMIDIKYDFYTKFTTTVPRGENRAVENAGHSWIHIDREDAVVQAIWDLFDRIETGR